MKTPPPRSARWAEGVACVLNGERAPTKANRAKVTAGALPTLAKTAEDVGMLKVSGPSDDPESRGLNSGVEDPQVAAHQSAG